MHELSVGDGFKFGCGFFIAGLIAWLVMTIVLVVLFFALGTLTGSIFEDLLDTIGRLLPLLALV